MNTAPSLAEIAVNQALRPADSRRLLPVPNAPAPPADLLATFHYRIPADLGLSVGHHVWVDFNHRFLQGIVVGLNDDAPVAEERLKPVGGLLHPQPMLSAEQIALARWISEHYHCALYDALNLMLPRGFEQKLRTVVNLTPRGKVTRSDMRLVGPAQRTILDLLKLHGELTLPELAAHYRQSRGVSGEQGSAERVREIISQLAARELVKLDARLDSASVRTKQARYVRLTNDYPEVKLTGNQQRTVAALKALRDADGWAIAGEVQKRATVSLAVLHALAKKGIIETSERPIRRDPMTRTATATLREFLEASGAATPPPLTTAQTAALRRVVDCLDGRASAPGQALLLHGVTSSGKTEVYLQAIDHVLANGGQAIVLVPEISLTPQTVGRFAARFPGRLAVLHSGLSDGERHDEWQRIANNQADIVVGARSAVFAPLPRLQLIVIDEEHEGSYKQDDGVRYHARTVAVKRAALLGPRALVVLGSATPDVESYQRAMTAQYGLLEMPERVGEFAMPPVQVVDMRAELRSGNASMFSRPLYEGIEQTLAAGKQAILFLNRRGTATFVMCRECGFVVICLACEIPMAYHGDEGLMLCHRCDRRSYPPSICVKCHSRKIKHFGVGTQKVVEEVNQLFPTARVLRWDRDATTARAAHDEILGRFVRGDADIMVGTQMIAKGLDIPTVTMVGVVSADTSLYLPDFRAGERTFQLLTQVAGRAGRRGDPATVIFQTYTPEHYAIAAASAHDYANFYRQEIFFRQDKRYPPFSQLISFVYTSSEEAACKLEAERFARVLKHGLERARIADADLIGPAPAFVRKDNGRYRWQIIVRGIGLSPLLREIVAPHGWSVDVDPGSVL